MSIPYPPGEPLTCRQIRELDVLAIEHVGIPGLVLMENAGRAIAEFVYHLLVDPPRCSVVILCGPGNNGGDGFVAARHLRNAEVPVTVILATPRDRVRGDAAANLRILERLGQRILEAGGSDSPGSSPETPAAIQKEIEQADILVDALLGTGSQGAPRGVMAELIRWANAAPRAWRIAVDIPSGLDADRGECAAPCFQAHATVTLVAAKTGFMTPAARDVLGRVVVADIGAPRELIPGRPVGNDQSSAEGGEGTS